MRRELITKEKTNADVKKERSEILSSKNQIQTVIEEKEKKLSILDSQLLDTEKEIKKTQKELEEVKLSTSKMESAHAVVLREFSKKTAELDSINKSIKEATDSKSSILLDISSSKEELIKVLKNEVIKLMDEKTILKNENKSLLSENAVLTEKKAVTRKEISELENLKVQYESSIIPALEGKISHLNTKIYSLDTEHVRKQYDVKVILDKLNKMDDVESELNEAIDKKEKVVAELALMEKERDDKINEINKKIEFNKNLESTIDDKLFILKRDSKKKTIENIIKDNIK